MRKSSITSEWVGFQFKQTQVRAFDFINEISLNDMIFSGPKTHSRLIVSDVIKEDSGNYTCSAPNAVSSSILVFVSPGK